MNKICFICPRELSVQHISDSFFVYNPVRHNMQMQFLQNQINAIHYKVGGDSPPDDKPVEPRVYYPCKFFFLLAEDEWSHSPRREQSVSQFYQVSLSMQKYFFCDWFTDIHGYSGCL